MARPRYIAGVLRRLIVASALLTLPSAALAQVSYLPEGAPEVSQRLRRERPTREPRHTWIFEVPGGHVVLEMDRLLYRGERYCDPPFDPCDPDPDPAEDDTRLIVAFVPTEGAVSVVWELRRRPGAMVVDWRLSDVDHDGTRDLVVDVRGYDYGLEHSYTFTGPARLVRTREVPPRTRPPPPPEPEPEPEIPIDFELMQN